MLIFLNLLIIWILIGVVVNIITNKRIPFLSSYSNEEIEDLLFDIKFGPVGPIYFFIYLLEDWFKDKDD